MQLSWGLPEHDAAPYYRCSQPLTIIELYMALVRTHCIDAVIISCKSEGTWAVPRERERERERERGHEAPECEEPRTHFTPTLSDY